MRGSATDLVSGTTSPAHSDWQATGQTVTVFAGRTYRVRGQQPLMDQTTGPGSCICQSDKDCWATSDSTNAMFVQALAIARQSSCSSRSLASAANARTPVVLPIFVERSHQ